MSFTHPNVIEIYATGDSGDRSGSKPFFVMAKLQGHTLAELIEGSPQDLTVQRTIDIIVQVCRGLQAAHDKGLVHRDIKPSNIFVLQDNSVKVIDFGVAHLRKPDKRGQGHAVLHGSRTVRRQAHNCCDRCVFLRRRVLRNAHASTAIRRRQSR